MRISDWSSDVCSSDLFGRQDIVRMNDLEFLAIGFQLAGDEALFMERQQLTRPARVPAEINQRDILALSIRRMDAERRTSAAARVVIDGRKLNGNDAARIGHIKLRHPLPVAPPDRKTDV